MEVIMLYERLSEHIKEYPKLNEFYQAMVREEYFITNITTTSMSPVQQLDFTSIEVGKSRRGESFTNFH